MGYTAVNDGHGHGIIMRGCHSNGTIGEDRFTQ